MIVVEVFEQPKKTSLVRPLLALRRAWILPVVPRLFLLGFTLAQPFLIYTSVNYTSTPYAERNQEEGKLLIAAYLLVFLGYSVSRRQQFSPLIY